MKFRVNKAPKMKLKLPQPKSLDLIVVVTFNLIECRAKMHFIFLILGLFLPKKKSDHQAKSISAYCVYFIPPPLCRVVPL